MTAVSECLAGYRVIELAQYLPGPFAGQMLSDLGAEVVKIEPPSGDPMRRLGPLDPDGVSSLYRLINAGKSTAVIDLKTGEGRDALADLLAQCDVLLESYRPGALEKLGLGPTDLAQINPRLIHCALTGFGHSGPYAKRAGHDINYMALAGAVNASGLPDRPVISFPPVADYASAQQAAVAVIAALLRRERTGQGGFLDVSLSETVLAWQALALTEALRGEAAHRGQGLLSGGVACYQIYRTADRRFVTLGALEEKFWRSFCSAMKRPDWIDRHNEPMPQEALTAEVAQVIRSEPLAHWRALLDEVDCCFFPVLTPDEVVQDPHHSDRGLLHQDEAAGSISVAFPTVFDGAPPAQRRPLDEQPVEAILRRWCESPERGKMTDSGQD